MFVISYFSDKLLIKMAERRSDRLAAKEKVRAEVEAAETAANLVNTTISSLYVRLQDTGHKDV